MTTIRDTIQRDLADEIQSVIKVEETSRLLTDLREYVVTEPLAKQFSEVLQVVVDAARPASGKVPKVGIWVSGFFGSGKSHFSKILGHLVANTMTLDGSAMDVFATRLHPGKPAQDRLAELLQEARNYGLGGIVVPFDIAAFRGSGTEPPERIALKAFYHAQGFSYLVAFAEREMQLREAGLYDEFLQLYETKNDNPWAKDQNLGVKSPRFAACLAELLPGDYPTVELAHKSIELALNEFEALNPQSVAQRLVEWLDREKALGRDRGSVFFVADEVGAWAGRNLDRIEGVRALVQQFEVIGKGRLWLLATSQEKLSDVVQNAGVLDQKATRDFLSRLEARFEVNVHLEPSEVGTVIEDRVLRKKPAGRAPLEQLFKDRQAWLTDVAAKPGLETLSDYAQPTVKAFVDDYPFLPYQLPMAADIFGAMRGVKVSAGARSMLKVAFEATLARADEPIGAVVSWDLIFDAANGDNEFADENYLGTPGIQAINRADEDLKGHSPFERPSRILKALWLMQQSNRVPTTTSNLARLLAENTADDILDLEHKLAETLNALMAFSYVKRDAASSQWRFLTPDEVTVEKIVTRIAGDIAAKDVRDEAARLYTQRLSELGSVNIGKSLTPFPYGVQLNGSPIKNDSAPVQLKVLFDSLHSAARVREEYAAYLEEAVVYWTIPVPDNLEDRLRRMLAIRRLKSDQKFNEIRTPKTDVEAEKLVEESGQLADQASSDLTRALGQGSLFWGGGQKILNYQPTGDATVLARPAIEAAITDRIAVKYPRFSEGDKKFDERNIDRLLDTPPAKRAALDPDLGIFDADGHVHADNVLVRALIDHCNASSKTSGAELKLYFRAPGFGWPEHLPRYLAAALFVDGRVALVDKTGRRHDNPKSPEARAILKDFGGTRVVVEENPLTPAEVTAVRELLGDLHEPAKDPSELTLHDATRSLLQELEKRLGVTERAKAVGLPLPAVLSGMRVAIDDVTGGASRSASLRALLAHAASFRDGNAQLVAVEGFVDSHGLDQFRRAESMIVLADKIGLADDAEFGVVVTAAKEEIAELKDQRRVIDEWTGAYQSARHDILSAYRKRFEPAYADARAAVAAARDSLLQDPDFLKLGEKQLPVRVRYMGAGCALQEIPAATLVSDADLIAAEANLPLPLLKARTDGAGKALAEAMVLVDELLAEKPKEQLSTWDTSQIIGKAFADEAKVDEVFDKAKEEIKTLIRQGKTVRTI